MTPRPWRRSRKWTTRPTRRRLSEFPSPRKSMTHGAWRVPRRQTRPSQNRPLVWQPEIVARSGRNSRNRRLEAPAAGKRCAAVETHLEIAGRAPLQGHHAFQIDQPTAMHARDAEWCQEQLLGMQCRPDQVVSPVGQLELDVIAGGGNGY